MIRMMSVFAALAIAISACAPTTSTIGADGKPLPRAYYISRADAGKIQFRMLDSLNALRGASGLSQLELESRLNAAAATHSRDMSVQNRPWLFGSDGSSPLDRMRRVGYTGTYIGEVISESYETELETLAAWMDEPETRRILMDRSATQMGFSWFQESNGKIWWTLVIGSQIIPPITG